MPSNPTPAAIAARLSPAQRRALAHPSRAVLASDIWANEALGLLRETKSNGWIATDLGLAVRAALEQEGKGDD